MVSKSCIALIRVGNTFPKRECFALQALDRDTNLVRDGTSSAQRLQEGQVLCFVDFTCPGVGMVLAGADVAETISN